MTDCIAIEGTAGTTPQLRTLPSGRQVANLRVASTIRRQDPSTGQWADAGTNWYSVACWGDLAAHVAESIGQGDPVLLSGRLRIASWGEGERQGTAVEIDAEAIGHSLRFGTTTFRRRARATSEPPAAATSTPEPQAVTTVDEQGWSAPGVGDEPRPASSLAATDAEPPF